MTPAEIAAVVAAVNGYVSARPWMDYTVWEAGAGCLRVVGGIDLHGPPPEFEIRFRDVFAYEGLFWWETDTSEPTLTVLAGDAASAFNLRHRVEEGYTAFAFAPEDYPGSYGCIVCARVPALQVGR